MLHLWGLPHDMPTRVDSVYSYMPMLLGFDYTTGVLNLAAVGGVNTGGTADVHPADGKVSPTSCIFCWNPGYREVVLSCVPTTVTLNLKDFSPSVQFGLSDPAGSGHLHAAVGQDPPITNILSEGSKKSRARVVDANCSIRLQCGISTYGTIVVSKMHPQMMDGTAATVRNAMIADRHSVRRIPFNGKEITITLQAPLVNRVRYGVFQEDALNGKLETNEDEPFGGYVIAFESFAKGTMDPDPTLTLVALSTIQSELGLDHNHLATGHKEVDTQTAASKLAQRAAGQGGVTAKITSGMDPTQSARSAALDTSKNLRGGNNLRDFGLPRVMHQLMRTPMLP